MNILCDTDGVLAQFTEHLCDYLGKPHTAENFVHYELAKNLPKAEHWKLDAAPCNKGWCWSVPRYEGAQQFLKDLVAKGHRVTLVTAPYKGPYWVEARTAWFDSLLSSPALRDVPYFFVSPSQRLTMQADVLIDDRAETIADWIKINEGNAQGFLMDRPWNRQWHAENPGSQECWEWNGKKIGQRVHTYKEILELL